MGDSSKYDYQVDDEEFLSNLIDYLSLQDSSKHSFITGCLSKARSKIVNTRVFSSRRNVFKAHLIIHLPGLTIRKIKNTIGLGSFNATIRYACGRVLDSRVGLDIVRVDTELLTTHSTASKQKPSDLKIQEEIEPYLKLDFLPRDLLNKGTEMSEAYLLLYLIENSLRFFISLRWSRMSPETIFTIPT